MQKSNYISKSKNFKFWLMKLKSHFVFSGIIFLAYIVIASILNVGLADESNLYINQELGISIKGPDKWNMSSDLKNNIVVNFDNGDNSNPTLIGLQNFNDRLISSLYDYAVNRISYKKKIVKGILSSSPAEVELNGIKAIQVFYEVPERNIKIIEYYFYDYKRNMTYHLQLMSLKEKFEENKKIFDEVIKTLRIE